MHTYVYIKGDSEGRASVARIQLAHLQIAIRGALISYQLTISINIL